MNKPLTLEQKEWIAEKLSEKIKEFKYPFPEYRWNNDHVINWQTESDYIVRLVEEELNEKNLTKYQQILSLLRWNDNSILYPFDRTTALMHVMK